MRRNPFLSIIIPALNAEQYVERCLRHISQEVCAQNLRNGEIEVIIIDDCSSDKTTDIANLYAASEKNYSIHTIRHQCNLKQGAARNTGLRMACGEYVWFVDVDDYISQDILCYCKSTLLTCSPDVFQFHARTVRMDGTGYVEPYITDVVGPIDGKSFLEFEAKHEYTNRIRAPWSKWYRRHYLLDNELFFQEGVFWEDVLHTLKCIYLAKSIVYAPIIAYTYVLTPNSDMRGTQNGRKFADTIRFCADSCSFLKNQNAPSSIIESLAPYYNKVLRKYKSNLNTLDDKEIIIFCEILKSIDLTNIRICLRTDEHNWLMNQSTISSNWNTK